MGGFKVDLAIEKEEQYFKSYEFNHPNTICLNEDITQLECETIASDYIKNREVQGIIGGPPCIGFSSVGNRRPDDPRNMLIFFFIKWVEYFKPLFYVMENVTGILSMGKGKVVEKVKAIYEDLGYTCNMQVLLAADYGVPQLRERVFFIGSRNEFLKNVKIIKLRKADNRQRTLFETHNLPGYLTVRDAISDIIDIEPFNPDNEENAVKKYASPPLTDYQKYLRKTSTMLQDHFAPNHSKEVIERISYLKQGENHGSLPKQYQLQGGYPNIYGRLHLDCPADTITGNCGCVSAPGRFIHPTQNRAISVREAARLQSFPDHYRFFGSMKDRYKQVGNAVPPLLSLAISKAIKQNLEIAKKERMIIKNRLS